MLKKIFYSLVLLLDKKIGAAKVFKGLEYITIGENSFLYPESRVCNMKENRDAIVIGVNTHIRGELMTMNYGGRIEIGDNCFVGEGSRIWSGESIKIGSDVLISHNVNIFDTDTHEINTIERAIGFRNLIKNGQPLEKGSIKTAQVVIEDNVWVSFNVIILKGVKIGKGSVIAAGSVITSDVPEFCVVAGNPAKIINQINPTE